MRACLYVHACDSLANAALHSLHLYGFSPKCRLRWPSYVSRYRSSAPHSLHSNICRSARCRLRLCERRMPTLWVRKSHWSHTQSFFSLLWAAGRTQQPHSTHSVPGGYSRTEYSSTRMLGPHVLAYSVRMYSHTQSLDTRILSTEYSCTQYLRTRQCSSTRVLRIWVLRI